MVSVIRRFLAVLAGCGFAASTIAYVESYRGKTMDDLIPWALLLHLGVFVLFVPMVAVE
jgi:hypothetical protein